MEPIVLTVELCVIAVPVTFNEDREEVPPIAPVSVTVPVAFNMSACAPFIVFEKERFEPVAVTGAVRFTGPVMDMGLAGVVVSVPPKLITVGAE